MNNRGRIIIYAPNIHNGGGFVLLRAMLQSWPNPSNIILFIDKRAIKKLEIENFLAVYLVSATLRDRLNKEYILSKVAVENDLVLCFNGLPPIFRTLGKIIVYQQNALLIKFNLLSGYKLSTALRIYLERFISYIFRFRVAEYVVQNSIMENNLRGWYGSKPLAGKLPLKISIVPFALYYKNQPKLSQKKWDFIYVADGLAHKNHDRLLEAWLLLANEDIMPSLVLTVPSDSTKIISKIDILQSRGLNIINIGPQSHEKLQEIYSQSKVLIYPSLIESFGLPLIEASLLNLDVISSELDYVYEVCRPIFTFDPYSPPSIARSVKKYLGLMEDCRMIFTPKQFCEIIGENLI